MPPKKKEDVKSYKDFSFRGWMAKTEDGKKADLKKQANRFKIKMDDKAITDAVIFFDEKYGKADKKGSGDGLRLGAMSYDELVKLQEKIKTLLASKINDEIKKREVTITKLADEVKGFKEEQAKRLQEG